MLMMNIHFRAEWKGGKCAYLQCESQQKKRKKKERGRKKKKEGKKKNPSVLPFGASAIAYRPVQLASHRDFGGHLS